jgi:hypothetical protein
MKTDVKTNPANATNGVAKQADTPNGAKVSAQVLKAEKRTGETKTIGDVMEAIRNKAKLVSDLQNTIDRRNQLQQLYSEGKLRITILKADSHRDELSFNNENIVDYIVKGLVEKSKEVESDITAKLIELEK